MVQQIKKYLANTVLATFLERQDDRQHFWHYLNLYRPFYDSIYQPVWMWERGRSKRTWIRRVEIDFDNRRLRGNDKRLLRLPGPYVRFQKSNLDNFGLDTWDWAKVIIVTLALIATPLILAFLTSFYTPTVGLSCRSFTFLMYFIFQFLIGLTWLWDFQYEERSPLTQGESSWLPSSYSIVMGLGLAGSLFTTIAGTFLQILGVYRNCLCSIPISAWSSGIYNIVISTNSADDIKYAEHFWLPTGITSIVILILVCYVGWWYQRHWRRRFTHVIENWLWKYDLPSNERDFGEKGVMVVEERHIPKVNGAGLSPEIQEL